ncbi:MAG: hypothetical protein JWR90_1374 [Marmoricola sp.]|jgi:uncharacterized protein YndB with AHSA1/START domain|nr:hypothetical protein [Marmoricola sp.]
MSKPQTYEATVEVRATPQRVWQVWTDVARWPEWTDSVTSVELLDSGPLELGSRLRIRQPRLPVTVWTVTDLVEHSHFSWTASAMGVSTVATHEMRPSGEGCSVTARIEQGGPLSRVLGLAVGSLTQRYLSLESAGLKRRSEE